MAIRLDPRRLSLLKQLAGEAGLRPGELVTQWIEGRLDAERSGTVRVAGSVSPDAVAALSQRLDDLARRVDQLSTTPSEALGAAAASEPVAGTKRTRRAAASGKRASSTRGRRASANPRSKSATRRVPLHEEIASVISESGPMSAAQIAQAIVGRGRYTAPRSARPLDAATVNSRISNPTYRSRFRREDGKIGLAQEA